MSKSIKFIFIIAIIFILLLHCTFISAVDVDMNINNTNSTTENTTSTTSATQSTANTQSTSTESSSSSNSSQFSTTVSTSRFDLQLTNILSICLIVVGVLLILLGIAILIRLKH